MTVSYTGQVATCRGFGCFLKLLFRWKGSIYKLVWPDLFMFLVLFMSLQVMYVYILTEEQQAGFKTLSSVCRDSGNLIPISFILGFYVSIVVGRWWDQYRSIPWADALAVYVSACIQGQDEKARVMRRTIMRYCVLSMTQCFTMISPRVKKRFPTLDHLIDAGLLLDNERDIIEGINQRCTAANKSFIPIVWACSIVTRARKEGKIRDDPSVRTILDELNKFRAQCSLLISYDWISVPLVYTQVCTLAVYSYFAAALMGSQFHLVESNGVKRELEMVFPLFTTLQFFFYMGWLKVAESLVNPFGDDDDDFELNWLVDRNLQVAYLIVDEMHHDHPELVKDQYWDECFPLELPHTVASEAYREGPPIASTANIKVSQEDGEIISSPSVKLDEMPDYASIGGRRPSVTPSKRGSFLVRRRERTSSVRSAASQSTLAESVSGRLSRAASIVSVFRRLVSRTDRESNMNSPTSAEGRLQDFYASSANVPRKVFEEVIPELDENMTTIISMKQAYKPTVHEIFGSQQSEVSKVTTPTESIKPGTSPSSRFMVVTEDQNGTSSTKKDMATRPTFLPLSPASDSEGGSGNTEVFEEDESSALVKGSKSKADIRRLDSVSSAGKSSESLTGRLAKSLGFKKSSEELVRQARSEVHDSGLNENDYLNKGPPGDNN